MYIHIHTRTTTVLHRRLKQMYWIIHFQVTFRLTPNRSPAPFTNRLCVFTSVSSRVCVCLGEDTW